VTRTNSISRLAWALGMASAVAVVTTPIALISGRPDPAALPIGCFLGMLILVGLTPAGKDIRENRRVSQLLRRAGRPARRKIHRALRRGEPIDAALAPTAVTLAEHQVVVFGRRGWWKWWLPGDLLLIGLAIAADNVAGAVLFGSLAVAAPFVERRRRAVVERATNYLIQQAIGDE
jgi:hypothetical protein